MSSRRWQPKGEGTPSARIPAPSGSPDAPGPLSGLRVIDLSALFAVPYIGGLLADLGAEVIKVESPWRLDQSRAGYGATYENKPGTEFWNRANTFEVLNRGKRVICVDLRSAGGQDLLRRLAAEADVILDNFTPRVLRQWNLTFAELSKINPRLIMLSNTGFGSTGPWSAFKSQGTTLEATMGWMNYTGYPDGPPSKAGQSAPDFIACWTGLLALMAALTYRERTGDGQWIDLGMYQLGPSVIPEALLDAQLNGPGFGRRGAADIDALISGVFPTSEDDHWIAISVRDLVDLGRLATVIPAIASSIGPSGDPASAGLEEIRQAITEWTSVLSPEEAFTRLQAVGNRRRARCRCGNADQRPADVPPPVLRMGRLQPGRRHSPAHRAAVPLDRCDERPHPARGVTVRRGQRCGPHRHPGLERGGDRPVAPRPSCVLRAGGPVGSTPSV